MLPVAVLTVVAVITVLTVRGIEAEDTDLLWLFADLSTSALRWTSTALAIIFCAFSVEMFTRDDMLEAFRELLLDQLLKIVRVLLSTHIRQRSKSFALAHSFSCTHV